MQHHPFGRTGLVTSRFGLGLAALGRPGYMSLGHADDLQRDYDVASMRARAHAVMDAAREAGVLYFDAARSYGRAEEFLAEWLAARAIDPGSVVIASKWGYRYTAGWRVDAPVHEEKEHSLERLTTQLAETRAVLGSSLRLHQIHSVGEAGAVLHDASVLRRLAELREEGVLVGLSVTGPRQADTVRRALEVRVDGAPLFASVQATWNVLEAAVGPALAEAAAAGLGVVIKEPLANGRLTAKNDSPRFAAARGRLESLAARLDTTLDALALAAVLEQPFAHVVLSGAATIEQLRSNLASLELRLDDEARAVLAELREEPEAYWRTRARLPWN